MWSLIRARPAGFPWLAIAGKLLAGWLVIDLDGTLITARSDQEGAAPTFKMGYGFHPLGAWCAIPPSHWRCCCGRGTPEEPVALWVAGPNPRAQAFYRKHGFVADGAAQVEGGVREIRMVRGRQHRR